MPTLKQVSCSIEWAETCTAFKEYGTVYGDGLVETFVVVPEKPQPFSIRVSSKGFIAEGLAALVFTDGVYQCNRNRVNLRPQPSNLTRNVSDIDFRMRQKEKPIADGTFIGREWRFDRHNIVPQLPLEVEKGHLDQLGTIEILILRCRGKGSQEVNHSRNSSTSGADTAPLENRSDSEGKAVGEIPLTYGIEEKDARVEVLKEEGLPFMGLFDGASDLQHIFGLDGPSEPSDGFWSWTWHPYSGQGYSSIEHGDVPHCPDTGTTPSGWLLPVHNQPSGPYEGLNRHHLGRDPLGVGKRVHFDFGNVPHPVSPQRPPYSTDGIRGGPRRGGQYSSNIPRPSVYSKNIPPHPQQHDVRRTHTEIQCGNNITESSSHHHEYGSYQSPWQMCPDAAGHPQNTCHDYQPCPLFQDPLMWPLNPQVYRFGPLKPTFIPPHHHNYPHCQPGGGNGPSQNSEPELPQWVQEGINNLPNNPIVPSDPTKEENQPSGDNSRNFPGPWLEDPSKNVNDDGFGADRSGNHIENTDQNNGVNAEKSGTDQGWNNDSGYPNAGTDWEKYDQTGENTHHAGNESTGPNYSADQPGGNWSKPMSTADQIRPLYGPHGPYFTFQSSEASDAPAEVEEEPRYDVPQSLVCETGTSRQVQPGRGYLYYHYRCIPEYIDSCDEPYARFVFKYRTSDQLYREIGQELDTEPCGEVGVQEIQHLDKQQIIEMLLRAQNALGGKIPSPPPKAKVDNGGGGPASMQPVPIAPPNTSFLQYSLPAARNVGNAVSGPTWSQPQSSPATSGGRDAPSAQRLRENGESTPAYQRNHSGETAHAGTGIFSSKTNGGRSSDAQGWESRGLATGGRDAGGQWPAEADGQASSTASPVIPWAGGANVQAQGGGVLGESSYQPTAG